MVDVPEMVTLMAASKVMVIVSVSEQPLVPVAVTVYVPAAVIFTDAVVAPVLHK
jgi:hypothetical protein